MQATNAEVDTSPVREEEAADMIDLVPDAEDESLEVGDEPSTLGTAAGQGKKKKRNKKKKNAAAAPAAGTEEQAAIEAVIATLSVDAVEFNTGGGAAAEEAPIPPAGAASPPSPAAGIKSPVAQSSPADVVEVQAAQEEESKDATPVKDQDPASVADPSPLPAPAAVAAASPVAEDKSPTPVKAAEQPPPASPPPTAASPKAATPVAASPKPASPAPAVQASPAATPAKQATPAPAAAAATPKQPTPAPAAAAAQAPVPRTSGVGFVDPLTSKDAVAKSYLADTAKAWGGGASPSPLPKAGSVAVPPGKTFYAYEELKQLRPESGIDMTAKEQYLSDEEFVKVFSKERAAWGAQPAWRRQLQKKEAGLW